MKITQRIFQHLVMMVCLVNSLLAVSEVCSQTAYPIKPIKIIVGFAPGSSSDVAARVVGDKLGQILGQSVIVENRPGGSSSVAAKQVSLSPPDGYTLFLCTVANVINTVARIFRS